MAKKSQWNFSMTEEIYIHYKNEKVPYFFEFLEETWLSVLQPVSSISKTVNFPKFKVFPNISVLLEHSFTWCLEWNWNGHKFQ